LAFIDHFSEKSDLYARARPTYPDALFEFIASQSPARDRAWDCATGSGQAAQGLARCFAHVEATDASAEQIAHAIPNPQVRYSVQPAEKTELAARSFDAVCVAQALHWFDLDRFYAEVKRVLRPGGVFAAWGYATHAVTPDIDAAFAEHFLAPLAPWWPAQNAKLWAGYRDMAFPFDPIEAPAFAIEMRWSLAELIAYAGTWSATRRYIAKAAPDCLERAAEALAPAWGDAERRVVTLPLHLRCGRHSGVLS
jgi:SAM-dependent methyltransferase